jgi:hypothetical protein
MKRPTPSAATAAPAPATMPAEAPVTGRPPPEPPEVVMTIAAVLFAGSDSADATPMLLTTIVPSVPGVDLIFTRTEGLSRP